jgi:hypothetical protein
MKTVDGNFVEQFQTRGFDARIWELYLFAAFREMNYGIERVHAVPDFECVNPLARFAVGIRLNDDMKKRAAEAIRKGMSSDEYRQSIMRSHRKG